MSANESRFSHMWIGPSSRYTITLQLLVFLTVVTASWAAGLAIGAKLRGSQFTLEAVAISGRRVGVRVLQTATRIMIERGSEWSQDAAAVELVAQGLNDLNKC